MKNDKLIGFKSQYSFNAILVILIYIKNMMCKYITKILKIYILMLHRIRGKGRF